jgi:serine-type D-Ala-D-Ala carboxypeptidase
MREFANISSLMQNGVDDGVFPGAVLTIVRQGATIFKAAFGWADLFSTRVMKTETIFDLASLTKPLATTLAVAKLIQDRHFGLDAELSDLVPVFRNSDKAGITVRQLLAHTSGLPAYRPYYRQLGKLPFPARREALQGNLVGEVLVSPMNSVTCYSDIGFMMLHLVVESVTDKPLNKYVKQEIYAPLRIDDLFFIRPGQVLEQTEFAATEWCPWRHKLICATVHDENAAVLGGVAGQAGLFGTASAVADLLIALGRSLDQSDENDPIHGQVLGKFVRRQGEEGRALGFDVPSKSGSSSGRFFSRDTIGHLGFTGTSFWMDLESDIAIILLTNRIHPSRHNTKIRQFRPRLHDLVFRDVFRDG